MSENTQNQNPKQEQYSLNDDRRVKVLCPGGGYGIQSECYV